MIPLKSSAGKPEGPLGKSDLVLFCGLSILAAVAVRLLFLDHMSNDYKVFLSKWIEYFRMNGGFAALGGKVGDYNFPYLYFLALFSYFPVNDLYLIKSLSIVFDLLLAFTALKLVSVYTSKRHILIIVFFVTSMLPTVVTNSSMWGQCDSIYASLGLLGLYFGLKKRPVLSVTFAALAFSFKLQIVFLLPVYAVLLIREKIRIRHIAVFPLVYLATVIPAVLMGRPITDAITIYTDQVGLYSEYLTLNAPSVFAFFSDISASPVYSACGIAAAFAFLFLLLIYSYFRRQSMESRQILLVSALMTVFIPFFLPSMHERYFYLADILTVVCAFQNPVLFPVPVLMQLASWSGYQVYLFGGGVGIRTGAALLLAAGVYLLAYFIITVEKSMKAWKKFDLTL